jgi:two-component system, OmpR family, sensor histidine kinase QseC
MSLQRRLMLYLLLAAPLVWGMALLVSVQRAQRDVNELFDTELIRLARQVQVVVADNRNGVQPPLPEAAQGGSNGEADLRDLAIAVWDAQGQLILSDREGGELPRRPHATGFVTEQLQGELWRMYYLQGPGNWLIAVGQKAYERDELVFDLTVSQILPWLLVLPVLLAVLAWAVRRALAPVLGIAADLRQREASDLKPLPARDAPAELMPLLKAINAQFARIDALIARERRFTADAAHEMRTPLAVLRAQWDVVRRAKDDAERKEAQARFSAGLDRMDRMVTQMLAMSRVESRAASGHAADPQQEVNWPAVVQQAISECLALAGRRRIEFACEWADDPRSALPVLGDPELLTVMLRNLLDNAARYAPAESLVQIRFTRDRLEVENAGAALEPAELASLGERFRRPKGLEESGSGLGISIVQRIAALHGLEVAFGPRADGTGMKVVLTFAPSSGTRGRSAA